MPIITIDGKEIEVPAGYTVIQACEMAGVEIPRFCYHERLHIAGNCRMCLVEVSPGPPKPQASCALPVADKMVVKTNTPMVKKAREGVMEFLLINHPLDCPICDQGGECDLQDQAMAYGTGISRYHEHKRAVEEKYMGPLIKTEMNRCIHCTRCVRFITDVAGVPDLGATGRGEHMEITTYVEKSIGSELSANIVDLCPVGALTSKPYAFLARPWELKKTESIDVMDAVGSNIRVDSRGEAVLRILPRLNEDVNEEWISDKTRHACDGLRAQRLDRPYIRVGGKLREATWEEAFSTIAERLKGKDGKKIAAIAGDLACSESLMALKDLMDALGSPHLDCRQDGSALDNSAGRSGYVFNSTIAGIEQADVILLIGTNPRTEAPILNSRIRKAYLRGGVKIYSIGAKAELNYPVEHLGDSPKLLNDILAGKHPLAQISAKRPAIIVGQGAFTRADGKALWAATRAMADKFNLASADWNGFNILHSAASRVAGLDLGVLPASGGKATRDILNATRAGEIEALYLLGADEIDMSQLGECFVIYQGHHGDAGANRADVVLPGAAYTEKDATYVNTEGRPQRAYRAVFPPGQAKEDWKILRALSEVLGKKLPYDTLEQLRTRVEAHAPTFIALDQVSPSEWKKEVASSFSFAPEPFTSTIQNFYMTDPISRVSINMAECSAVAPATLNSANAGKMEKAA